MIKKLVNKKWLLSICIICLINNTGCKKLVETDPPSDRITQGGVFANDGSAIPVLNNLYNQMNGVPFQGVQSISMYTGLSSDELSLLSAGSISYVYTAYFQNALDQSNHSSATGGELWVPLFLQINRCNDAIEGLNKSTNLTPAVKKQLLGEAKFLRAFYYFYLVNLFGDVPIALTTDPEVNTKLARSPKEAVYEQILADLKEAEELMASDFLDISLLKTTTERVRPTKWAATALLARVYLYLGSIGKTGMWPKAEESASALIANTNLFELLPSLNGVFLKNSREAIWQIQPTAINLNTVEGNSYIIPSTGPAGSNNPVSLSQNLRNSFEVGDNRAALGNWINKVVYSVGGSTMDSIYFLYKYKKNSINSSGVSTTGAMTEYFMVLRLAEQYLIRAEARAQLSKISEAQSDLNAIRNRAGLGNTTATDQASLLTAILNERRHELFCEWGNRWLDLKRTGNIDAAMTVVTPIKSAGTTSWQPYKALYPLPYAELQKGPNLKQNMGY